MQLNRDPRAAHPSASCLYERREPGGIILGSVMPWEMATIVVLYRDALRAAVKVSEAVAVFVMVGR